jgi:hypothetical protein
VTNPWLEAFRKPRPLANDMVGAWFARIADLILNRTRWVIADRLHRITECEFYYRSPAHHDPFTHGDPVQVHPGRWYFHKTAGVHRGGSFKGVDVTFGDGTAQGGILFRGLERPDGTMIDGPSLLVDHVLSLCAADTVADLHGRIADRRAWDPLSPMHFEEVEHSGKGILACARVGLSLRRARPGTTMPAYLTRPYRFLTEPAMTAKGKSHMVMGLHRLGRKPEEIRLVTNSPARSIATYIGEYENGLRAGRFEDYFGKEIGPRDLCRLHGIADRASGVASMAR